MDTQTTVQGQAILCNVRNQLEDIVSANWDSLIQHRGHIVENRFSDILSSSVDSLPSHFTTNSPFHLHLILSADGGNFFSTKKKSFWPIQLIIADLPIRLRVLFENRILLALTEGKPDMAVIYNFLSQQLSQPIAVGDSIVYLHLHGAIFDLPAFAYCTNMTQFNGEYGCFFCLHPGHRTESGRGYSRTYKPGNYPLRTDQLHKRHVNLSVAMNQRVCGVKGNSELFTLMSFPSGVSLDVMHCLYEGVAKQIINFMLDSNNRRKTFYIDSRKKVPIINNFIHSVQVPHDFDKFLAFDLLTSFTATTYKNTFFYLILPICIAFMPVSVSYHIALLVFVFRRSNDTLLSAELLDNMDSMLDRFFELSVDEFPVNFFTLNFHLLSHMPLNLRKYGPAFNLNMFPFERAMKKLKSMYSGTVNEASQIVESFILYKKCTYLINSNEQLQNDFLQVLNLHSKDEEDGVIGTSRYRKNNIMYHSASYAHKKTSVSYYCFISGNHFCEISKFNQDSAVVKQYQYSCSLLQIIYDNIGDDRDCNLLKCVDKYDFSVINMDNFLVKTIPISELLCRCMLIRLPVEGDILSVMVRLVE